MICLIWLIPVVTCYNHINHINHFYNHFYNHNMVVISLCITVRLAQFLASFISPGQAQDLAPGACCAPPHTALHQWGPGCGGAPFFHPNPLQSWCLNFCRHHIESLGFMMHISMLIILWWKTTVTCNWGDTTLLSSPRSGGLAWGCLKVESQSWCLSKMVAFPWKMSGLWGSV